MAEPVTTTITALGIVDTAVKIGLGALISGVATYYVTKLNHSAERGKEMERRKAVAIEKASEEFDKYFAVFSSYIAILDGQLKSGNSGAISKELYSGTIEAYDKRLVAARPSRSIAMSRCELIGAKNACDELRKMARLENDIRNAVVFNKMLPTSEELEEFRKRSGENRAEFYRCMHAVYTGPQDK